jgi:hypothetical protein
VSTPIIAPPTSITTSIRRAGCAGPLGTASDTRCPMEL